MGSPACAQQQVSSAWFSRLLYSSLLLLYTVYTARMDREVFSQADLSGISECHSDYEVAFIKLVPRYIIIYDRR